MSSEGTNAVELWQLDLAAWSQVGDICESVLTSQELQQAQEFRFHQGRERFILGRGMMRHVLAHWLRIPATEVVFRFTGHGKPHLADAASDVQFNLSHSGDLILLAVTRGVQLGVDIERRREIKRRDQIAQGILAAKELKEYEALSEPERQSAFFTIWTRKEAIIKAVGRGLSFPLTELEVSFDAEPRLLRYGKTTGTNVPWHLSNVACPKEYVASLATGEPVTAAPLRVWSPGD